MEIVPNFSSMANLRNLLPLLTAFVVCLSQLNAQVDEIQILLSLKANLQDPSNALSNWESSASSPCQWNGITCNTTGSGSVTEINLERSGLTGPVPFSAICGLKALKGIQLGSNSLYGNISDGVLNNCSQLETLNLTSNSFAGTLPDFSALGSLQSLDLSKNNFAGKFPVSVTSLTQLYALNLNDNPLEQSLIPIEIFNLKRLNRLQLSNCSMAGPISPYIANLTELGNLELSYNYLTGTIPVEITRLTKLYQLELFNNYLTGEIPSGFRNLTSLRLFDASENTLNGTLSEFASMNNLVSLQLYKNNISGQIPSEFGEFQYLQALSLYENNLTGPLPQSLGSLSDFTTIDISQNGLSGTLPPDICKRGKLVYFLVLQNFFTGEIPNSYGECSTLTRFRVNNNYLTGRVPSGIWGLPHATIIDLSFNTFVGGMDQEISKAKNLSELYIQNNQFSGSLPPQIKQAILLAKVDASNNGFSGELPVEIGNLSLLNNLLLQNNMFSGPIPQTLELCGALAEINLAVNRLNGSIPASLGSMQVLNSLNLSNNQLSGQIPNSLSSSKLSLLDFSNNQLTGPVSAQLIYLAGNHSFSGNPGLCVNNVSSDFLKQCPSASGRKFHTRLIIACTIAAAALVILVVGCLLYRRPVRDRMEALSWDMKSFHKFNFTDDDILHCLKEENMIGSGGSGKVYRGELGEGQVIAVKQLWTNNYATKLNHSKEAQRYRQFKMEVETLGSIRHKNIVKLYCCISSTNSNLLVYEYMKNGSLWDRLHQTTDLTLDWQTRYKIALGIAHALVYLHNDCVPAIVHRDVKSSNILLDEDYEPRIADFGIAKILQSCGKGDSTAIIAGTHGYIAPEYAYTYKVSEKSDVYSFGVVLMELVTGRQPIEPDFGENKDIVSWISRKIATRESTFKVMDSRIPDIYQESMIKVLKIALLCTSHLPSLRPFMLEVVDLLLEANPCPASSNASRFDLEKGRL